MARLPLEASRRHHTGLAIALGCALTLPLALLLCAALSFLSWSLWASSGSHGGNRVASTGRSGPAGSGQSTFERQCAMCHSTGTDVRVGPGLAGLFDPGGPRLPAGVDYNGRLPNGAEITDANVAEWIRSGGSGQIGHMPPRNVSAEEMADLIAYLKTLKP